MTDVKATVVNAFTKDGRGGNAAGVVSESAALSDAQMKAVAARLGCSETAFIQASEKADFRIRFFAPKGEVGLCGHATIASFATLLWTGRVGAGLYTQEAAEGVLQVQVNEDDSILMDQLPPTYGETIAPELVASVLRISSRQIASAPQIVSTGLRDIIVAIESRDALLATKPDFARLVRLSERYDVVGLHAFALDAFAKESIAHCRNFAPRFGIQEESATGTSNGALACYLFNNGRLSPKDSETLYIEQGYSMGLPSEVQVRLRVRDRRVTRVQVGGRATLHKTIAVSCQA